MRRKGSPWTGLWAILAKELADQLSSTRMRILEVLILLTALGTVYAATSTLRATVAEDPFVFLKLFTTAQDPIPSFVAFLGFLIPLTAIALGFDAINSEHARHTLGRILSQPIYRDALLAGKFLAGLGTLAILLVALWLVVTGMGILFLGLPPGGEEVARGLLFLLATLAFAGVWLGLAMLFSVLFRQPATAALAALSVWLFFAVFWDILAQLIAGALRPVEYGLPQEQLAQAQLLQALARISPNTLYGEIVLVLLNPSVRALGPVFFSQLQGAVLGSPLPLSQSLLLIWPHLAGLIAAVLVLFAIGYVVFQRQEARA